MTSARKQAREDFVARQFPARDATLAPASADASFRSYWRVRIKNQSWIVMDAPPDQEPIAPWLDIGARLRTAGLHTPKVLAADSEQGFVLMEDLGSRIYLPELNDASADDLYGDALEALLRMQRGINAEDLPHFDAHWAIAEMELMPQWFLQRHLQRSLTRGERSVIEDAFRLLAGAIGEQPRAFIHRDYHSRNLLVVEHDNPGIVDFQDAMLGPITYDLVSLLRDCYIVWPSQRVDAWVESYRHRLTHAGLINAGTDRFRRWFDLSGVQRHIKVLGVFCRLCYRDGKTGYLADLPLVLQYVLDTCARYPQLADLRALLESAVGDRGLGMPRAEPAGTEP